VSGRGGGSPRPTRRSVLQGLLALPLAPALAGCRALRSASPPHIVLLVVDTLRAASLPFHGYPRPTAPFLTSLAQRSTVYQRCYSAATWTRPAVTSLLSGLVPLDHRQSTFNRAFPPRLRSLPQALRDLGYRTGFFSANHAVGEGYGMEAHFDHVSCAAAKEDYLGPRVTEECRAWLRTAPGGPLFAYLHYFPPHGPYLPPEDHVRALPPLAATRPLERVAISLGNTSLGRIPWYQAVAGFGTDPAAYVDRYDAHVRFADALVAGFFAAWEELVGERTVVVVTADHGEDLEEHGHWFDHARVLSERILHVPLLFHDTARPRRRVVEQPVSHLDVGTTLVRLAGGSDRLGPHGVDLGFGDGRPERRRHAIVSQVDGPGEHRDGGWALTRGRWRLVYNDTPLDGLGDLLAVRSLASGSPPPRRAVLLPRPVSLGRATTLAPRVRLLELELRADPVLAGERYPLRGRLALEGAARGALWLRFDVAGQRHELGAFSPLEDGRLAGAVSLPAPVPRAEARCQLWGAWQPAPGEAPREDAWLPLASFALLSPRPVAEGMELLGVAPATPALCAGDSVRVTHWWRLTAPPAKHCGLYTHLLDAAGATVARDERLVLAPLPEPAPPAGEAPKLVPLIEEWRLKGHSFAGHHLDLGEQRWLTLPTGLAPGSYELHVGLFDFRRHRPGLTPEAVRAGGGLRAARLEVAADPREAFLATVNRSPDLGCHQQLWREELVAPLSARHRRALEGLARAYPDEPHLLHLLAADPAAAATRRTGGDTLAAPLPRALARLAPPGGGFSPAPARPCDVRFADEVRLFGFDLHSAPDDIDDLQLTLYWEALRRPPTVYSGELYARGDPDGSGPGSGSCWWFLGGVSRPTTDWRLGEVVMETVQVPRLPAGTREVFLSLSLTERWEQVYANGRLRVQVPSYVAGRLVAGAVPLGSFPLATLPRAATGSLARKRGDDGQFRLYDTAVDPGELYDLAAERPEVRDALRRELLALMARSVAVDAEAPAVELPAEVREKLRSLGYAV
jgi:arylsulfatase A-like enzyme